MKTKYIVMGIITMMTVATLQIRAADDKDSERIAKQAKESADRASKEAKKTQGDFDVKKSHDDHIPATEKAAADAQKRAKDKK